MDGYSMPSVGDSATPNNLPYVIEKIAVAAAAVIEEIVNASESALDSNGSSELLASVMRNTTTMRVMPMREAIPWWVSLAFLAISVSMILVGVAGNAFVVAVIVTDRKLLHSSVNLFLLNLALADMGNLIFTAPDVVILLLEQPWVLPDLMCPLVRFLQQYFLFASVLLQMSIGIERFMAICTPLQMQRFSRRTTVFFLLCAWSFAAIFAAPQAYFSRTVTLRSDKLVCMLDGVTQAIKTVCNVVWFAILYLIPLLLLTVLYFIMCRRLWGKECIIAGEMQQMAILKLRRSVVKMLVISMLIYFICYTPVQTLNLGFFHFRVPFVLRLALNMMVIASSAANPIVYIMCCRHFHQRFVSIVNRTLNCCMHSPEKYQTVITDDKYARMSVVTHSSTRRYRKVKQRERSADISLSVRLLPQIDTAREVDDSLGDATVMVEYGRALRRVGPPTRRSYGAQPPTPPSTTSPSPSSPLRQPRTSTVSATSYHWAPRDSATSNNSHFRHFRCTNPKKSTEMITVD